jgi:Xaa-Pro aminopeptidase
MWPVNGRFTPEQRALYGFYLRCYRALIAAIRAGRTPAEILAEALREWDKAALEARFVKPEHAAAARAFVAESKASAEERPYLGHWVGMATHDVGSHAGPLRPGMAFTIEPQFRVPEGKIYIRLEDLIVVKENGIEVVSDWLPSDPDAIEKAMAEEGLLQRYPRDEDFDALQP